MPRTKKVRQYYIGKNKRGNLFCTKCNSKKVIFAGCIHSFICSKCGTYNLAWGY